MFTPSSFTRGLSWFASALMTTHSSTSKPIVVMYRSAIFTTSAMLSYAMIWLTAAVKKMIGFPCASFATGPSSVSAVFDDRRRRMPFASRSACTARTRSSGFALYA
jgi:hypothetical protein